jgi:hypothetical protein
VAWQGGCTTHIEVKLWDCNFEKTFETARQLRCDGPEAHWNDAILIPARSIALWDDVTKAHPTDSPIGVILWNDVAMGLRKSLWERREPVMWQAWAWAFCNAVESHLLGLRKPNSTRSRIGDLDMISQWIEILTTAAGREP